MTAKEIDRHLEVFREGAVDLVSEDDLRQKLALGNPLRIKQGFDPSAPDLHLGHTVGLQKLRDLQDLGHTVIFLVGDFTAQIGDQTGTNMTRPALSPDAVHTNAQTYVNQVSSLLDIERCEVRYNGQWMNAMTVADLVRLTSQQTVGRMLERDDFATRYRSGTQVSIHECCAGLINSST